MGPPEGTRGARGPWLAGAAVVAAVACLPAAIVGLRGLRYAHFDLTTLFLPNLAWWWSRLRLPGGWNPWVFAGFPANADPLTGQLHPFGLLWAAASPLDAALLEVACTGAVAGMGMLVYLRLVGCGGAAAVSGGVAFALGGFMTGHVPHPPILRAAMAIPWALAAIEGLDGAALVAGLGLAVAAVIAGGHPQTVAYALAVIGLYAACLGRPLAPGRARALSGALVLGIGLVAAAWLPAIESIRLSSRAAGAVRGLGDPWLAPEGLRELVAPFAAGGGGPLYGGAPPGPDGCDIECVGYPGMLTWLALLAGCAHLLRDRSGRFWLALAGGGLLLAMGAGSAVHALPGVRAATRFLLWWNLGVAAAAALALGRALESPASVPAWRWVVAACAIAAVLAWTGAHSSVAGRAALGSAIVLGISLLVVLGARRMSKRAAGALVVGALGADLVVFAAAVPGVARIGPGDLDGKLAEVHAATVAAAGGSTGLARTLVAPGCIGANWAPFVGMRLVQGYNALAPRALTALLGEDPASVGHEMGLVIDPSLADPRSAVLDLLRVEWVYAARAGDPLTHAIEAAVRRGDDRWEEGPASGEGLVFRNRRARPVAWVVHRVREVPAAEALRLVRGAWPGAPFDPALEALSGEPVPGVGDPPGLSSPPVRVTHYGEDEIRLLVEAAADGLLVTSELAHPGWTATVDGRPARVRTVNVAFRAVEVASGRHDVVFRYRPRTVRLGLLMGGLSAIALGACAWRGRRRRACA